LLTKWALPSLFGEDEPKRAEKKRTSFRAADTVSWRPPKATDISNKLAAPSAIEQYHQMCGRTTKWRKYFCGGVSKPALGIIESSREMVIAKWNGEFVCC
jgi:hypothetical protein